MNVCRNGTADVGAHEEITVANAEVGLVSNTVVAINLNNPCTANLLPATAITGLTIEEDTGGGFSAKTISGCARQGSNQIRCTVTAAFSGGSSARFSYATGSGNVSDARLIGGLYNQRLNAVTNFTVTNNVSGGGGGVAWSVVNARAYEHGCGEVCSAVLSSSLTKPGSFTVPLRGSFLLRVGIKCTGGDCETNAFAPWYRKSGGSYAQIPTRATGTEDLSLCPAPVVTNGQATTQQITTGTFVAGQVRTIASGSPSVDLAENGVTEIVYSLCVGTAAAATDVFDVQMRDDGGDAITNTVLPGIKLQNPSRAKIEIGCDGIFRETDIGYECVPAAPGDVGDVEITMAGHLAPRVTRRATDRSNAVYLDVPKNARVRINGVVQ